MHPQQKPFPLLPATMYRQHFASRAARQPDWPKMYSVLHDEDTDVKFESKPAQPAPLARAKATIAPGPVHVVSCSAADAPERAPAPAATAPRASDADDGSESDSMIVVVVGPDADPEDSPKDRCAPDPYACCSLMAAKRRSSSDEESDSSGSPHAPQRAQRTKTSRRPRRRKKTSTSTAPSPSTATAVGLSQSSCLFITSLLFSHRPSRDPRECVGAAASGGDRRRQWCRLGLAPAWPACRRARTRDSAAA
jgi:hypothetical protein